MQINSPNNMIVFPQLYTERLKLRKLHANDIPFLVTLANNRKISSYVLNMPYPYQEPDAVFRIGYVHQGFKTNTRYVFAIAWNDNDEFIGEISLHLDNKRTIAQLAYWIGEPFWNKGIATEAIAVILKFGFEKLNLETIFATCDADNVASCKVLEKNRVLKRGVTGNILHYSISKTEHVTAV